MSCENEVSQQPVTDDGLVRIRAEYLEMPGLRLTTRQAQRLGHLDGARSEVFLNALVDAHFLWRTADGAFVRRDGNSPVETRMAATGQPSTRMAVVAG